MNKSKNAGSYQHDPNEPDAFISSHNTEINYLNRGHVTAHLITLWLYTWQFKTDKQPEYSAAWKEKFTKVRGYKTIKICSFCSQSNLKPLIQNIH